MNAPIVNLAAAGRAKPHSGETIVFDSRSQEPPALSVIVPVYNAERHIRATLHSIVAAGTGQIEIVAVNDGSSDESESLICSWATTNSAQVLLLRQPNSGSSAARNTGLRHVRGTYVAFLDSDDMFDGAVYRQMINVGETYGCDVITARAVCFSAKQSNLLTAYPFFDDDHWQRITRGRHVTITTLVREPHLLRLEPNVNRKMVRREFLDRIRFKFPVGLVFEDLPSHVRLFGRAKSIALVSETGLFYRAGGAGQLTSIKGLCRFDMIKSAELVLQEAQDCHLCTMAGGALIGQVARMLYWCGQNVPAQEISRYFSEAAAVMRAYPIGWRRAFLDSVPSDLRERIIVSAFNGNATNVLTMMAQKRPQPLAVLRFALSREGGVLGPLIRARLREKVLGLLSRLRRV
jgi:Glycosyl transferase family 2